MLAEADDGERVERLGLEAGVDHGDAVAGREVVVGDGLDQGQGDPLGDRGVGRLDLDRRSARPRARPQPAVATRRPRAFSRPGRRTRSRRPSQSSGPSGRISKPATPSRAAASKASASSTAGGGVTVVAGGLPHREKASRPWPRFAWVTGNGQGSVGSRTAWNVSLAYLNGSLLFSSMRGPSGFVPARPVTAPARYEVPALAPSARFGRPATGAADRQMPGRGVGRSAVGWPGWLLLVVLLGVGLGVGLLRLGLLGVGLGLSRGRSRRRGLEPS